MAAAAQDGRKEGSGNMIDERMEKMSECFRKLKPRIMDSIEKTDLEEVFAKLRELKEPTIVTGVGGSSVVSSFFSEVIENKNHIICTEMMPRDLLYRDLSGYKNVVACSYSGGNIGVKASFDNDLKHYLFSANRKDFAEAIQYVVEDEEWSFVSIAGTLVPMSILFLYYTDNNMDLLNEILEQSMSFEIDPSNKVYEVMHGYENHVSAKLLESGIIEGSLGAAILHEKYNFCHGRSQLNESMHNDMIFYDGNSELDELYRKEMPKYYKHVIFVPKKYDDCVIADFHTAWLSMQLVRQIAEAQGRDISEKNVPDISEVMYTYKGGM